MNKVILIGRLVADPEAKRSESTGNSFARYKLAVDRPKSKDGEQEADFISCVAFGKNGEFATKWLHKGMKIAVEGRIQTGRYVNKNGDDVYTTDVVVSAHEFCESKKSSDNAAPADSSYGNYPPTYGNYNQPPVAPPASDFAMLTDDDSQLPF